MQRAHLRALQGKCPACLSPERPADLCGVCGNRHVLPVSGIREARDWKLVPRYRLQLRWLAQYAHLHGAPAMLWMQWVYLAAQGIFWLACFVWVLRAILHFALEH